MPIAAAREHALALPRKRQRALRTPIPTAKRPDPPPPASLPPFTHPTTPIGGCSYVKTGVPAGVLQWIMRPALAMTGGRSPGGVGEVAGGGAGVGGCRS